jgi:hypothetical protein
MAPPYRCHAVSPVRALTPPVIKLQNRSPPASEAERKSSADNGVDRDPQPLDLGLRAQIRTAFQLLADRVLSLMGLVAAGREADASFTRPFPLRRCPNAKHIPTMTG